MLVESGLNETEKMGFDTFVTACSDGKGVHECAGFRLLEHIVQDDREWGRMLVSFWRRRYRGSE
jgi:hypothetical protein